MANPTLPPVLEKILTTETEPDAVFSTLLPALGEVLQCHRCFLYLRDPQTKLGKVPFCWRCSDEYPDVTDADWKAEPESLPSEDPLFAAALRAEASIFVQDVETANPDVVNRDFERKTFGHRALIHSHLCQDGLLWGILQPCVFGKPRVWTEFDRSVIAQLEPRIAPLAVAYVKAARI
ncbi:MAG: GAF domain-containing protein [Coleofasciculus sp. S288]|nr:GAF domain-containing protein [Coleofasciculus sp. S288]